MILLCFFILCPHINCIDFFWNVHTHTRIVCRVYIIGCPLRSPSLAVLFLRVREILSELHIIFIFITHLVYSWHVCTVPLSWMTWWQYKNKAKKNAHTTTTYNSNSNSNTNENIIHTRTTHTRHCKWPAKSRNGIAKDKLPPTTHIQN